MKIESKIFFLSLTAAASLLTACQDEDFGYSADAIKYEKNFTDVYGDIPSDKSWDLSSYTSYPSETTRAGEAIPPKTATNGQLLEGTHFEYKDFYEVPTDFLDWMNETLVEGRDNRFLGSHFVMRLPENDFAIIPIFQGASAITSELEMKVNGYDITKIWTKSQNIEVKDKNGKKQGNDWEPIGYFDGWSNYAEFDPSYRTPIIERDENDLIKNVTIEENYPLHPANTIGVSAFRAKPIYFTNSAFADQRGYFYLSLHNIAKLLNPKTQAHWNATYGYFGNIGYQYDEEGRVLTTMWDENNEWTTVGDRITSVHENGYMLALNVPTDVRPSAGNLPDISNNGTKPSQVLLIGVEDANGAGSDHDINDIAFLVVGYPNVPEIIPANEVIKKRYMCEDLGATDDFDFNDIVVDVTQTMEYKLMSSANNNTNSFTEIAEGIYVEPDESTKMQYARISHVCGTLPFQVRVGDALFPKVVDPTNDWMTRSNLSGELRWCGTGDAPRRFNEHYTRSQNHVHTDGWNPNEERVIGGWDPKANNVKIYVDWSQSSVSGTGTSNQDKDFDMDADNNKNDAEYIDFVEGTYRKVDFPSRGSVPYMLCTDQDVPWMQERQNIPQSWVDGSTRERTDKMSGAGAGTMYYNYGHDHSEAYIWIGEVRGKAKENGVIITKGSTYHEAMLDAIGGEAADTTYAGKGYHILNVYTQPIAEGKFSLAYPDANGKNWTAIDPDNDADYYLIDATQEPDENGHIKTTIMLSPNQESKIRSNGLVIVSQQNGLVINKVTMDRFRVDTTEENRWQWQQGKAFTLVAPTNGKIMTTDRSRSREGSAGLVAFTKAYYPWSVDAYTELGNCSVAAYNSTVTLIAQADAGYKLKNWVNIPSGVTPVQSGNRITIPILKDVDYTNISAEFKSFPNPNLALARPNEAKVTLAIPSKPYTINFNTSSSAPLLVEDADNRFISVATSGKAIQITPLANVGETKFTVRQEETDDYAASATLTITVKVISKPTESTLSSAQPVCNQWTSEGVIEREDVGDKNFGTSSTAIFGNGVNIETTSNIYADLCNVSYLFAETPAGALCPRFFFNQGVPNKDMVLSLEPSANANAEATQKYMAMTVNNDNSITYIIDVKAIKEDKGTAHLNCVRAPAYGTETTVNYLRTNIFIFNATVSGNGTVSLNGGQYGQTVETEVAPGQKISVEATPNVGSRFKQWSDGNRLASRTGSNMIQVDNDMNLIAEFATDYQLVDGQIASDGGTATKWYKVPIWDVVNSVLSGLQNGANAIKITFDYQYIYGINNFYMASKKEGQNATVWQIKPDSNFNSNLCTFNSDGTRKLVVLISKSAFDSNFIYQDSNGNAHELSDLYFGVFGSTPFSISYEAVMNANIQGNSSNPGIQ